jgi:hypothetical protein
MKNSNLNKERINEDYSLNEALIKGVGAMGFIGGLGYSFSQFADNFYFQIVGNEVILPSFDLTGNLLECGAGVAISLLSAYGGFYLLDKNKQNKKNALKNIKNLEKYLKGVKK